MLINLEPGKSLPADFLVARFCSFERISVKDGTILHDAFMYRKNKDTYLSLDCLEHYKNSNSVEDQLRLLIEACNSHEKRLNIGKLGKFVVAKVEIWQNQFNFSTKYKPQGANDFPDHVGLYYDTTDREEQMEKAVEIKNFFNENYNDFIYPVKDLLN